MSGKRKGNALPPPLPGIKATRSRTEPDNSDFFVGTLKSKREPKLSTAYYDAIGLACNAVFLHLLVESELDGDDVIGKTNTNDAIIDEVSITIPHSHSLISKLSEEDAVHDLLNLKRARNDGTTILPLL